METGSHPALGLRREAAAQLPDQPRLATPPTPLQAPLPGLGPRPGSPDICLTTSESHLDLAAKKTISAVSAPRAAQAGALRPGDPPLAPGQDHVMPQEQPPPAPIPARAPRGPPWDAGCKRAAPMGRDQPTPQHTHGPRQRVWAPAPHFPRRAPTFGEKGCEGLG